MEWLLFGYIATGCFILFGMCCCVFGSWDSCRGSDEETRPLLQKAKDNRVSESALGAFLKQHSAQANTKMSERTLQELRNIFQIHGRGAVVKRVSPSSPSVVSALRRIFTVGEAAVVLSAFPPSRQGLSFDELATIIYIWLEGSMDDKLKLVFHVRDFHNDGRLTRAQLCSMIKSLSVCRLEQIAVVEDAYSPFRYVKKNQRRRTDYIDDDVDTNIDYLFMKMNISGNGFVTLEQWLAWAHSRGPFNDFNDLLTSLDTTDSLDVIFSD